MVQALARTTCPRCQQPFSAPIDQVLDVDMDPTAKSRLLSGQVNLIVCPHCGAAGALGSPFLYHDAAKELALVFMPLEAGQNEMERQKLIGSLSRAVMKQLPSEQRKGYLLNPQIFFSLESLIEKVLEADGVTPEMIAAQKARTDLFTKLLKTPTKEARLELIRENEELLDNAFFYILADNLSQLEALGNQKMASQLAELRQLLFEETALGRRLAAQSEAIAALRAEPTREKLVALLISSEDPDTRTALLSIGQPLVDYLFFQLLTQHIEATTDKAERKRLENLRQEVLDVREKIHEQIERIVHERVTLMHDLLLSDDPERLARRHLHEIDEIFLDVLNAEAEKAQEREDYRTIERLEAIWQVITKLMQEMMPPQMRLLSAVMEAESEDDVRRILQRQRPLVDGLFLEMLEHVELQMKEQEDNESAQRAAQALRIARAIAAPPPESPGQLEIAKR